MQSSILIIIFVETLYIASQGTEDAIKWQIFALGNITYCVINVDHLLSFHFNGRFIFILMLF